MLSSLYVIKIPGISFTGASKDEQLPGFCQTLIVHGQKGEVTTQTEGSCKDFKQHFGKSFVEVRRPREASKNVTNKNDFMKGTCLHEGVGSSDSRSGKDQLS